MFSRSLFLSLLVVCLLGIVAQFAPIHDLMVWDRQAILTGQWWRILTGNLTHTNWPHLAMNLSGLIILCYLFRFDLSAFRLSLLLFLLSLMVGLALFLTQMNIYAGLSGVLHGLFIWGACQDIRLHRKGGKLLLAAGVLKVAWDVSVGGSAETAALIEAHVAVEAHLAGALGGALLAITKVTTALGVSNRRA
ncbi:rhombosortase [Photobacterium sp. GJ3]|uniref:rhombosortase n=1 Tax=Photobacterium sp. GJ3 TaxID=2829502 RepID=UPI0020136504|nr:rhombosortase [Photobacterium sp. GJ3]